MKVEQLLQQKPLRYVSHCCGANLALREKERANPEPGESKTKLVKHCSECGARCRAKAETY